MYGLGPYVPTIMNKALVSVGFKFQKVKKKTLTQIIKRLSTTYHTARPAGQTFSIFIAFQCSILYRLFDFTD